VEDNRWLELGDDADEDKKKRLDLVPVLHRSQSQQTLNHTSS